MKKIFLLLLVLFSVCGAITAQTPNKVLKVHKNGEVTHTHNLSDIDSLTVEILGETPNTPDELNGHEYVDLGLPSGTLWATCNVGAYLPADYGDYFAWGETKSKTTYDWNTYRLASGSNDMFKYNTLSSHGTIDNKTVLEAANDAATANWGSDWRMPTREEFQELGRYCTWIWTGKTNTIGDSIYGYELISKFNDNSIFLPAVSNTYDTSFASGNYWSSSLFAEEPNRAYNLNFSNFYLGDHNCYDNYRYHGFFVRPVRASDED